MTVHGGVSLPLLLHQVHRRGPVAVAVEQRAADAAVEDVVERLVMRLGRPLADELVALFEAADAQPFLVGRAAAEAAVLRRVRFLNAFHLASVMRLHHVGEERVEAPLAAPSRESIEMSASPRARSGRRAMRRDML